MGNKLWDLNQEKRRVISALRETEGRAARASTPALREFHLRKARWLRARLQDVDHQIEVEKGRQHIRWTPYGDATPTRSRPRW